MKCQHCGKNEATFYYKSNINGAVMEQHLCADCARELGYADGMANVFSGFGSFNRSLFGGFDDLFAPMPALAGNFFEPFEAMDRQFARMFPQLGSGSAAASQPAQAAPAQSASGNDLVSEEEHRKLDRERRMNALRTELNQAIQTENFERAAQLRDQIHGLESQQ